MKTIIDDNGDKIVVISEKLFTNNKVKRNTKAVVKTVRQLISELNGSSVIIKDNNSEVFFDKFFSEEYVYSKDSRYANISNKTAKMNAVKEIKIIIENAYYLGHSVLKKETVAAKIKRGVDALNGFDYYRIKFAIEKEKCKYQFYSGILNVRIDKNNKNFAYDITKISEDFQRGTKPLNNAEKSSDIL